MRRVLGAVAASLVGVAITVLGASSASASTTDTVTYLGPECSPSVVNAVLNAVGPTVAPGTVIQYIQVAYDPQRGYYIIQPCVVTVPQR
jgi:hypothetical protein